MGKHIYIIKLIIILQILSNLNIKIKLISYQLVSHMIVDISYLDFNKVK